MTEVNGGRKADIAIAELNVKVQALQDGQEKVFDKLDEMHGLLHDQCAGCPPAIRLEDHEIRIRNEEQKSNELEGKVKGLKTASGLISSVVGFIVAGIGLMLKLHK